MQALSQLSYNPMDKLFGGGMRDRTADPLLAKQMLSQLSYTPTLSFCIKLCLVAFACLLKAGPIIMIKISPSTTFLKNFIFFVKIDLFNLLLIFNNN